MSDLDRISDNVRTMIGKGAPEADIDAYLKGEGYTPGSFKQAVTAPSAAAKVGAAINTGVDWAGTQLWKGTNALLGAPADLSNLGQRGMHYLFEKAVGPAPAIPAHENVMPGSADLNNLVFGTLGQKEVNAGDNPALTLTDPLGIPGKVNVGKMLDAGMQAVPGAIALKAAAIPSMVGGATSEAAGQATEGSPWEIPARIAAGVLGYRAGQKVQTPLPASLTDEQARLVQLAKDKGIPLTVGQETGRGRGVESAIARFPTSQGRMAAFADEQNQAINRDALSQAGATGERLDPTTMNRVVREASNDFEAAKNASGNVDLTPNFFRDLNKTITSYLDNTPAAAQTPSVMKRAADFVSQPGHTLTGEQYQEFRRTLNEAAQSVGDVGARRALQGMRNALDDAMTASLPADQAAAWREVRKNWTNLKILTKAAAGGTADSRNAGNLSPSALSTALRARQGVDRFASTEGGLNDTARLASYLADTRPNSGTPQTLAMQSMLTGGPVAGGYAFGGVPGALAAGAGMVAPNLVARAMTGTGGAGWLRNYLANQSQADQGLLSMRTAPFALAPGVLTLPPQRRLESRQ